MKKGESFKKIFKLFIFTLITVPIINAKAIDETDYKVYNENGEYEFTCKIRDFDMHDEDRLQSMIRDCVASNKGINYNRITISINEDKEVKYTVEYGSGILSWDGNINTDWYDETSSIYFIKNAEELAGLAYLVNYGNTFANKTIKLTNNIDLSEYAWVPIGKNGTYPFSGTFDGQSYEITGLNFNFNDELSNYGLFGSTSKATIKNLEMKNIDINIDETNASGVNIASLVANATSSEIINIKAYGNMTVKMSDAIVAGIVGNGVSTTVRSSQSHVNINSSAFNIAGIFGTGNYIKIYNCINFGNLYSESTNSDARVAGITSWVYDGDYQNLINYGLVEATNDILKSSILGYVGYGGETHSNVFSQDNINVFLGSTQEKVTEINESNIYEILNLLGENWEIIDGKIVNIIPQNENFSINVDIIGSGEIYYSGKDNNIIVINPIIKEGYELDELFVYDIDGNEIAIKDNEFTMPESDVVIKAIFKPINYQFIDGANAVYENADLIFTLDGGYNLIDKVLVNGEKLDSNNYIFVEDGPQLLLKNEYLKTLKSGKYELAVSYTNDSCATTTFIINEIEDANSSENITVDNPATIDNVLFYIILGSISIVVVVGNLVYLKKRTY